jgi:hypothetical protein
MLWSPTVRVWIRRPVGLLAAAALIRGLRVVVLAAATVVG